MTASSQIEIEGAVTAEVDGLIVDSLQVQLEDSSGLQLSHAFLQRPDIELEGKYD